MSRKMYFTVSAVAFTIVAVAHMARLMWGLEATVGGYEVPLWMSGVAVVVTAYLAVRGFFAAARYKEPLFAIY